MSENKRVTIPFLEKVLKPIVDLVKTKADKKDVVQSDLAETNPESMAFIKNKPDENTAMELAAEAGLIDPVTDENGAIYTDKNGEILSL
jgi:ubiquitin